MKNFLNISLALTFVLAFSAVTSAQNKVKWVSWDDAMEANKTNKKKFVVDIYTDWCGWCKKMDKATFQQDHIARYINKNFYAIKFDAEMKEDIVFNGQTYRFVKNGRKGYHELALAITQGKLSYPTVVFLDEDLSVIQPIPGFQDAKMFEQIMTYFSDDHYKNTPWATYTRSYKSNPAVHTVSH